MGFPSANTKTGKNNKKRNYCHHLAKQRITRKLILIAGGD